MDDCNYCGEINSKLLKEAMTATALEKTTTLNKKMDATVHGIKHSNLKREKCFFRNDFFLDHRRFYDLQFL